MDHNTTQKNNKFCVIGQKDGAYLAAYVYWQTGDQLIFWLPDKNDIYASYALTDSDVEIDLENGLLDKEDAGDEGTEMQRSYAKNILKACEQYGQKFIINKLAQIPDNE